MADGRRIVLRADGDSRIGLGHVARCLAVAEAVRPSFSSVFAVSAPTPSLRSEMAAVCDEIWELSSSTDMRHQAAELASMLDPADLLCLDGYHFDSSYRRTLRERCRALLVIDDLLEPTAHADVVLNQAEGVTPGDYPVSPPGRPLFLLGFRYALLRGPFLEAASLPAKPQREGVLVCLGGADVHDLGPSLARAVASAIPRREHTLVLGAANPRVDSIRSAISESGLPIRVRAGLSAGEMREAFRSAKVALLPASVTSLEAAAAGVPICAGTTAANQALLYRGLVSTKIAIPLGDLVEAPLEETVSIVRSVYESEDECVTQVARQRAMFDGRSGERLRAALEESVC